MQGEIEQLLLNELKLELPSFKHKVGSGNFIWTEPLRSVSTIKTPPSVAYAKQMIPNVRVFRSSSSDKVVQYLLDRVPSSPSAIRVHGLTASAPVYLGDRKGLHAGGGGATVGPKAIKLIHDVVSDLQLKLSHMSHNVVLDHHPITRRVGTSLYGHDHLIQLAVVGDDAIGVSVAGKEDMDLFRRCLSKFPCGYVNMQRDSHAPSSASQKLLEALATMPVKMEEGDRVCDLGASPGGWSYVALRSKCIVTSVDKAPIDPALHKLGAINHIIGDAFTFKHTKLMSEGPFDWMLCDVITEPARTMALLEKWIQQNWCHKFIVTIKFTGTPSVDFLQRLKEMLVTNSVEFTIRRNSSNKNELTVTGIITA
jgi:23S rRNA U2552 (ribose-2'-O)-methylase RlmE/FtsJ